MLLVHVGTRRGVCLLFIRTLRTQKGSVVKRVIVLILIGLLAISVVSFAGGGMEDQTLVRYTGVFSDTAIDEDDDGFFEWLLVSIEIRSNVEGQLCLRGGLWSQDGDLITSSPHGQSSVLGLPDTTIYVDSGTSMLALKFSGEQIRRRGYDGRYVARFAIRSGDCDRYGSLLDTATVKTSAYEHSTFRQVKPIRDAWSRALDSKGIQIHVEFEAASTEAHTVLIKLSSDTQFIAQDSVSTVAGVSSVRLAEADIIFKGWKIRASGADGPYDYSIEIRDDKGAVIDAVMGRTMSYKHTDFTARR